MNDEAQTTLEEVKDLKTQEIELPTIDVKKYIGRRVKIEKVTNCKGVFGYCVKVESEIIETITGGRIPIDLRASRIFGFQEDVDGNVGWGANTKLGVFLKKMKVSTPGALKGKEVIVQKTTAKSGTEFLTFD